MNFKEVKKGRNLLFSG